jgi:hypothetical protein
VYSGYLKLHGLKVLTVVFPNGIIAYLYGPVSAWENDIALLNMSLMNEHLMALQPEIAELKVQGEKFFFFLCSGIESSLICNALCMLMRLLWEEYWHKG